MAAALIIASQPSTAVCTDSGVEDVAADDVLAPRSRAELAPRRPFRARRMRSRTAWPGGDRRHRVRADETRSACDQYPHDSHLCLVRGERVRCGGIALLLQLTLQDLACHGPAVRGHRGVRLGELSAEHVLTDLARGSEREGAGE